MHIDLSKCGLEGLGEESSTRDAARWEVCQSVCEQLDASYRPLSAELPLLLRGMSALLLIEAVERARSNTGDEIAKAFGQFRAIATELEAESARRLTVLAGVVHDLRELRVRAEDPATIDHMLQRLGFFVRGAWRVEIPETRAGIRLWSTRVTRRYDLLPREWREL